MPGPLARIDDRWGIAWRTANLVRRFSLRRYLSLAAGLIRPVPFERPVFVIGVPRSGTTLLFRVLAASPELGALPREGHDMWRTYHHPRYSGWGSDAVGAGQVGVGERRFVAAYLASYMGRKHRRFVEKTPENSLRVPYLLDLFPEAHFIVVKRDPCDVINSLIQGWREPHGRFRSYFVPRDLSLRDYPHRRRWCFLLFDGWQRFRGATVEECAFEQWRQCTEALAAHRSRVAAGRWHEVHLEHLLARPEAVLDELAAAVEIEVSSDMRAELADRVARPVNALSPAGVHKWRRDNQRAIRELLPRLVPIARLAGYAVDPVSGDFEIVLPAGAE